ncbi:MAG TPA: hypothetical protein VFI25_01380 [Planctomycetota bacterium]|jgi:hypothetical protein|nr:hypothetical protein [Planctomycetota bacterium]
MNRLLTAILERHRDELPRFRRPLDDPRVRRAWARMKAGDYGQDVPFDAVAENRRRRGPLPAR